MSPHPFGIYVRRHRQRARLSIRELARTIGMSNVHLGDVESGKQRPFNERFFPALCDAMPGVDVVELRFLAYESRPTTIDASRCSQPVRSLVGSLAQGIQRGDISDELAKALTALLRAAHSGVGS